MPTAFIAVSLLGCVYFGVTLVTNPGSWLTSVVGFSVCLFLFARNAMVIRSNRRLASTASVREVRDQATLNEALEGDRAVVYKHSTSCPVSAVVVDEVRRFGEAHPDWPVYLIKVIERRDLSDTVATRLAVPHASPQVLVIRDGRCVWHTSHYDITAQALSRHAA